MAGQVQIKDYNALTLLDKYQKKLECQVKSWYMQEHFAVKTDYNETEALQAYLFIDTYKTALENCELYKVVNKTIKGEPICKDLLITKLK
jgi:hypothetical protein